MKRKILGKIIAFAVLFVFLVSGSGIPVHAADTNIAPLGTASTSYCSPWETLTAINDDYTPASSADTSHGQYGNWDNPGTTQWVQYDFNQNYSISGCEVYWFDDNQGIDLPTSCNFQYWNGTAWVDFSNQSGKGVAANTFNATAFTAAATTRIRLSITARASYSTGILEWRVWGSPVSAAEMAAYYKFDSDAADSSGNGKNATLSGATSYLAGKSGYALNLDGSSGYASMPAGIMGGLSDFTIAAWVRLDTAGTWARLFDIGSGTSAYLFLTPRSGSGTVRFAIKNGGSEQIINSAAALPTGVWKHVAVTLAGSTGILYIDGIEAGRNASITIRPSNLETTTNNYIGRSQYSSDPYLDGLVDELRIYGRALSASEIVALAGTASNTAPVVNAGADAAITLPATASLNGTAIDDGLPGGTLATSWSKESGPGTVTFANAGSLSTTATFSQAGAYVLKLTASDGSLSSSDTVAITVNPASGGPVVTTPPSWINAFYKKCVMINGIPICTTAAVPDQALITAYHVLDAQLKKIKTDKPAVLQKMLDNRVYVIIVGLNETNNMHPAWSHYNDPSWPRRGGGGNPTTVLEEDCIVPASDTWRQNFCGLVHEFGHTLLTYGIGDASMAGADPATYNAIVTAYNHAIAANKYTESSYDRSNYHEYFCGQSNRWFNSNPTNLNVPNAASKTDRQQLQEYDPEIYNILATLYGDYELPEPWN